MNLTGAAFDPSKEPMVASFAWEGRVPLVGSVLWQIVVHSADRQTVRRLGYKIVDGRPAAQFVWVTEGPWQANPGYDADLEVNMLTARFSPLALHGLGSGWSWEAVLSIDGVDAGVFRP